MNEPKTFIRRVVITTAVVVLVVGGVVLVVYAINFFFLAFAGVLFAVMLRAMTNGLHRKTNMPEGLALALSTLLFFGVIFLMGYFIAPTIQAQVRELRQTLPFSLAQLEKQLGQTQWGERAIDELSENQRSILPSTEDLINRATSVFKSTLNILVDVLIVVVAGIFFAVNPSSYQRGLVSLFPPEHRTRLFEVMDKGYETLKWWLVAKLAAMVVVGVLTGLGLRFLGVPLALVLAVIVFFLDFIPNLGPILAAVPGILIGLLQGPTTALYVTILYIVVQSLESYLLTPILYKHAVSISPVVTLLSIVLFGTLVGPLGVILATPLVAVIQVFVRELYIKDYLERKARISAPVASPRRAGAFSGDNE